MAKELAKQDDLDMGIDISDMMMIIMMVIMVSVMSTMTATTAQASQTLQAQSYTGLTDTRILRANPNLQWINLVSNPPYHPWITAYFFNKGPSLAYIAINNPDKMSEIAVGGDLTVDMTGADRRIELVFYKCYPGVEAIIDVTAKY